MYRTLFVPALNDRSLTASLSAALPIARTYRSHIQCFHVLEEATHAPAIEVGWSADMVATHDQAAAELATNMSKVFLEFCADQNIEVEEPQHVMSPPQLAASWLQARGIGEDRYPAYSRMADLIVLARQAEPHSDGANHYEEALVSHSGRPVLLTPPTPPLTLPGHPVIAWNGSREAARALALATPFLEHASDVTVVTVGDLSAELATAEDVAVNLQRQGIKATARTYAKEGSILETIYSCAEDVRGDLLVLGAYSHAQWREILLGGVTRKVLNSGNLPVLLAH